MAYHAQCIDTCPVYREIHVDTCPVYREIDTYPVCGEIDTCPVYGEIDIQQDNTHQDCVESTLMLQFNKH